MVQKKKDNLIASSIIIGLAILCVAYFWSFPTQQPMLSPDSLPQLSPKTMFYGGISMVIMFLMGLLVSLFRRYVDKKLEENIKKPKNHQSKKRGK